MKWRWIYDEEPKPGFYARLEACNIETSGTTHKYIMCIKYMDFSVRSWKSTTDWVRENWGYWLPGFWWIPVEELNLPTPINLNENSITKE